MQHNRLQCLLCFLQCRKMSILLWDGQHNPVHTLASLKMVSTEVTIKANFPCQHFDALLGSIPGGWRYGLICCICQAHAGTADSVRARLRLFSHHCPLLWPLSLFFLTAKNPLSAGSTQFNGAIVVSLWLCQAVLPRPICITLDPLTRSSTLLRQGAMRSGTMV